RPPSTEAPTTPEPCVSNDYPWTGFSVGFTVSPEARYVPKVGHAPEEDVHTYTPGTGGEFILVATAEIHQWVDNTDEAVDDTHTLRVEPC
ncbi:MAG: hypothetical protein NTZ48_00205, partial [Candidatus Omnitrophica bacterium]|nr:hypothetical protein [Candidatus Omnitrophota bacterium]